MANGKRMKLTDAAIARLRPREREYAVWDSRVAGLGVRVRPNGGQSCQSAFNIDPQSASKIDPLERHDGGCPGSQ